MANNNENKKNKQSLNDMLMNILFNIVIPVMILKKVPEHWDNENAAVVALCVALSFPIGFFIFDYIKTKKSNFISILGFISVLLTGVIGIFQIPNEYLAIKEASVPFIIMIVCLVSLITPFPVVEKLVYNDAVFNKDLINNKLEEQYTLINCHDMNDIYLFIQMLESKDEEQCLKFILNNELASSKVLKKIAKKLERRK